MHQGHPPFLSQFPKPLPRDPNSTFRKWVESHQDKFGEYDQAIDQIVMSHRITDATTEDLDEIGLDFGVIGQRRGRGDEEYRQFLLSIAESYAGRGTPTGMQFAISAGVRATAGDITITEHFDANEYSVGIDDWIAHRVSTIIELADLSDPSGVDLRGPITYNYEPGQYGFTGDEVVRGATITSPEGQYGFRASDTDVTVRRAGLGMGRFDGDDPYGEGVQTGGPGGDAGEETYGQSSYGEDSYAGDKTDVNEDSTGS